MHSPENLWRKVLDLAGADLWDNRWMLLRAYLFGIVSVAALLLLPWPLKLIIDHVLNGEALPESLAHARLYLQGFGLTLDKMEQIILFAVCYALIAGFSALCGAAEK